MNLLRRILVSNTLLVLLPQLALAVQPLGQSAPGPAGAGTSGIVERGGTIDAIDPKKKIMVVDGVSYTYSATSVKVHAIADKTQAGGSALKAGMQIRFNSSVDPFSGQNQVGEIWVTSRGGQPRLR